MNGERRKGAVEAGSEFVQLRGRGRVRRPMANALGEWSAIADRLRGKRLALFLDYDGTVTPIAPLPELATLPPDMRLVLDAVGRRWPVAIVSGRAIEDVEQLVGIRHLAYAGSHGFDIRAPGGLRLQVGVESRSAIRHAAADLRARLEDVPGAVVEDKRFAVALHFRQVSPASLATVKRAFDEVRERYPHLRPSTGKRVLELRPAVDWDKGRAVTWLLDRVGLSGVDAVPVCIGDDVTDEDAFRAVAGRGVAVLVGATPSSTYAEFGLRDTQEVREFLLRVAALAAEPAGLPTASREARPRARPRPWRFTGLKT